MRSGGEAWGALPEPAWVVGAGRPAARSARALACLRREALESSDDNAKIQAMQQAITMLLSGEQLPALFITIVRYVLPSENHVVQKLLLLYLVRGAARRALRQEGRGPRSQTCACIAGRPPGAGGRLQAVGEAESGVTCRLLFLQETIEKTDAKGKLLPEMVRSSGGRRRCGAGRQAGRDRRPQGAAAALRRLQAAPRATPSADRQLSPPCRSSSARTCATTCSTPTSTSGG